MRAGNSKTGHVEAEECWRTRNGSLVITEVKGGIITGTVIETKDLAFPVGTVVAYVNNMGHVLCEGSDDDKQEQCDLHPLDAETRESVRMAHVVLITKALAEKVKTTVIRRRVDKPSEGQRDTFTAVTVTEPTPAPALAAPVEIKVDQTGVDKIVDFLGANRSGIGALVVAVVAKPGLKVRHANEQEGNAVGAVLSADVVSHSDDEDRQSDTRRTLLVQGLANTIAQRVLTERRGLFG